MQPAQNTEPSRSGWVPGPSLDPGGSKIYDFRLVPEGPRIPRPMSFTSAVRSARGAI